MKGVEGVAGLLNTVCEWTGKLNRRLVPPVPRLVWDWRGTVVLRANSAPATRIDGGVRVECDRTYAAAFAVGGGPADWLTLLDRSTIIEPAPVDAAALGRACRDRLRTAAAPLAAWLEQVHQRFPNVLHQLEIHSSVLVLSAADQRVTSQVRDGVRWRLRAMTPGGPVDLAFGWNPQDRVPWSDPLWEETFRSRLKLGVQPVDSKARRGALSPGRLVLLPPAAGWAAHELGHAALETGVPAELASEIELVDDPRSAPHPAGFTVDDVGRPADRCCLIGGAGGQPAFRRSSIREAAVPAMSATALLPRRSTSAADIDANTVAVVEARAGRYDAPSGLTVLEVPRLFRWGQGDLIAIDDRPYALLIPFAAWQRVQTVVGAPLFSAEQAVCTRVGAVNAVMVGAPTITLEPVRLIPLRSPWHAANEGIGHFA